MFIICGNLNAQVTYTTVSNGSWNSASTWDNGIPPNTLPFGDSIIINHDVIFNATTTIQGVLIVGANGVLNNSTVDLRIGAGVQNQGELFNYGRMILNSLYVRPVACSSSDTKPVGYNFGDIVCSTKLYVGKNCGSGFFYNYLGSNVNLGTELHIDAYLCNEDTIVVQTRVYNHGGTIECCGYYLTPVVESNVNEGRPGCYLCSNFCTDQQTQPIFEVQSSYYNSFADAFNNAPTNHLTFDNDSTLTCDYNDNGTYVDLSTCYIELSKSKSIPLCEGQSVVISIDSSAQSLVGSSISWSSGQNTSSITVSPTNTTTYTVSVNDGIQTCMESIQVEVVPNPVVSAGSNQSICFGDSVVLSGSGIPQSNFGSLLFSTTQNFLSPWSISWPVDSNQYYILEVSGVYGFNTGTANCLDPAFVFCSGNTGIENTTCIYQDDCNIRPDTNVYKSNHTYYYTIFSDGSIDLAYFDTDYTDNTGSYTIKLYQQDFYSWSGGVVNGIAFNPDSSLSYNVVGTGLNGCSASADVTVNVNSLPTVNAGLNDTLCEGTSTSLSASGPYTFVWNNGVQNGSPFIPPLGQTLYKVIATDTNGCENTDSTELFVNALPIVSGGQDQTVCLGSSITLTASGADSLIWDNGVINGQSFVPNLGTTFYTVIGVDDNGCESSDIVSVFFNNLPVVDAGVDQTICLGSSVTLSGSGATSYVWDNGVVNGIPFSNLPAGTTVFEVFGTDGNGCVNSDQVNITVLDPSFNLQSSYCNYQGNISPLIIADSSGFFTSSNNSLNFIDSTLGLIDVSILDTGFYRIYHSLSSCVDSLDFQLVSTSFGYASSQFCSGDSIAQATLFGTSGGTFFTDSFAQLSIDSINGTIDIVNSQDTTFPIYYNYLGCTDTSIIEIISAEFNYLDSTYCKSSSLNPIPSPVILGSSGGVFSSVSNLILNPTNGEIDLSISSPGIYSIIYSVSSCVDSAQITIVSAEFDYPFSAYCVAQNFAIPVINGSSNGTFSSTSLLEIDSLSGMIDLNNSLDTFHTVSYQLGSCVENVSIQIINPTFYYVDSSFCLGATIDSLITNGSQTGVFSISPQSATIDSSMGTIDLSSAIDSIYSISHQIGNCISFDTIVVNNPTFSYDNSVYCSTDAPELPLLLGTQGGVFSNSPSNLLDINSSTGEINFQNSADSTFDVVYSINNCTDTFELSIVDVASILLEDDSICGMEYQIQNSFNSSANYLWSSLDTSVNFSNNSILAPLINVNEEGNYTIAFSIEKSGCLFDDSINIKFVDSIFLNLGPDLVVNQSFAVVSALTNSDFFNWYDLSSTQADILSPDSSSTEINNLVTGDYLFGFTASNTVCPEKYDEIMLTVDWIFIPNGFSPNADGINDTFGVEGARANVDYEIQIVNRWGELIFVSSDIFETWDGSFAGKPVIEGTYFYFIDLAGFKYKGFIELKR
ncbi:MAG: gliding motility-associated C-terminal domain-containing protein [Bacteroidota bacterium]|nr:gliding motility-associated C-terminal domain-containing protein [Bacteroidota bacterium]